MYFYGDHDDSKDNNNDNVHDDNDEEVDGDENWAKYISFLSSKPPINHC